MQVVWLRPTRISGTPAYPVTVKNLEGGTVYYRADQFVSSATNDGSITSGNEHEFTQTAFLVTAANEVAEVRVFQSLAATRPGRREIESCIASLKEGEAVGTYFFPAGNELLIKATALATTELENKGFSLFWYDPKLYEFRGKPTQLALEGVVTTNSTAPANSYKFGLYKVEKTEGAEKKSKYKFEAAIAASVAPTIVTPALETIAHTESVFSSSALAAGLYAIGVETITATTAAKSHENIFANLFAYGGESSEP